MAALPESALPQPGSCARFENKLIVIKWCGHLSDQQSKDESTWCCDSSCCAACMPVHRATHPPSVGADARASICGACLLPFVRGSGKTEADHFGGAHKSPWESHLLGHLYFSSYMTGSSYTLHLCRPCVVKLGKQDACADKGGCDAKFIGSSRNECSGCYRRCEFGLKYCGEHLRTCGECHGSFCVADAAKHFHACGRPRCKSMTLTRCDGCGTPSPCCADGLGYRSVEQCAPAMGAQLCCVCRKAADKADDVESAKGAGESKVRHRHAHPTCADCRGDYCPDTLTGRCQVCRAATHGGEVRVWKPACRLCLPSARSVCCKCAAYGPRTMDDEHACVACSKIVCLTHANGKLGNWHCADCVPPTNHAVDAWDDDCFASLFGTAPTA